MAELKTDAKVTDAKVEENKVAIEKMEILKKYLEEGKVTGFALQVFSNEVHAHAFRSNLPIAGQNLPFMILLDDSVYTIIQIQVAANIVNDTKQGKISAYINDLNNQYRMLKYHIDEAGNVLLTCCIPAGVTNFDPALVIAVLNQIQGHLNALYPKIMEKLWEK